MDRSMSMNGNTVVVGAGLPPIPPRPSPSRNAGKFVAGNQPTIGIQALALEGQSQDPKSADAKKLKRILASRQYSQKYRQKLMLHLMQLETEVKALQAEAAIKAPRINYLKRQNSLLRAENSSLIQKLSAYSGELSFKEAQLEELKQELEALKQLYAAQQQMPLNNQNMYKLYMNNPFGSL